MIKLIQQNIDVVTLPRQGFHCSRRHRQTDRRDTDRCADGQTVACIGLHSGLVQMTKIGTMPLHTTSWNGSSFLSILLALCEGSPPLTGWFPSQHVLFHVILEKKLTKRSRCRWFEIPWRLHDISYMYYILTLCLRKTTSLSLYMLVEHTLATRSCSQELLIVFWF